MIVADSNLLAYLLIRTEFTPQAERVHSKDGEWCAPILWKSEFRNILALYMRRGEISLSEALATMRDAEDVLGNREYNVLTLRVLNLVSNSRCTAYDCEFVALAQSLGVPLVTSDGQVLRNFPSVAISMDDFAST